MEKYILNAVFMLTLINIVSPDLTFAGSFREGIISDTGKLSKKVFIKDVIYSGRPMRQLDADELNRVSRFLIMDGDTGKYFHRFFFKDFRGMDRFADSMILRFPNDSVFRKFKFHPDSIYERRRRIFPDHQDNSIEIPNMLRRGFPGMHSDRFELPDRMPVPHKNSQSFSFRKTDKNGISKHIGIGIDEPSEEELKKITGSITDNSLKIDDLGFLPDFSSQRILLIFTLPSKGSASIKVLDSDYKSIYSDNTARFPGRYSKEISLPKNGIYFLVIRQNNKSFIKRLIKHA